MSSTHEEITITEKGKEIAKEIMKKVNMNIHYALSEYKELLNDTSNDELLSYIYSAYPNMIRESTNYEKLKPNIEYHILSLVGKQKISAQRASELLNKPLVYVLNK